VLAPRPPYVTSPEGLAATSRAFHTAHKMFLPPEPLSLSQWADRFAYIPKENSASPGKFHTSTLEYQRGIMDAITDQDTETVVLMLAAQSGKTQSANLNPIGYFSHWEPSPILCVQPTLAEAEKFSKNRIAKMIRDTPVLRELFPSPRSRDSGNTLLNKEFPGGVLVIVGANSPLGLRGLPARVILMDEVDGYEESAGTEGDPVDLAKKRSTKFWNRKIVLTSTPHIKHLSRIERAFDSSDKRYFFVPCPHCGEMQKLEWPRLKWKSETLAATSRPRIVDWYYVCVNGCEIRERSKHEMIRNGLWRATAQSHDGKTAGFHLNALYGVVDWLNLIQEWLEAQTSLERMKVFVNTNLAETWEIRGTGANMTELEKRQRFNREILPSGVLWLTAGVDTQDNRLECTIWGWGLDDERWAIEHKVFPGDPSLPDTDPASPWAALRDYLLEDWEHRAGVTMRVATALIDSGGHHTERVYEFTRKHELRRWHAIVGRAGIGKPLLSSGSRVGPYKSLVYTVGVDTAKEDVFTSLRIHNDAQGGPGYSHFSDSLDSEYFRQLTAEKLVKTTKDFVTTMAWVKTGERNEALDCAVYARAAVSVRRPNFRKIARSLFRASEKYRAERQLSVVSGQGSEETPAPDHIVDVNEMVPTDTDCHSERPTGVEEPAVASPPPAPPAKPKPAPRARPSVASRLRNIYN
jgi:phage terminase large subunit GpA-like protein